MNVRQGIAIHGAFLLFGVLISAFFPFFALFLDDRGLSPSEIGVVISAMALARFVFNPVWGHLADTRVGRRQAFRLGMAGAAAAGLLLFLLGHGFVSVLVTAFLIAAWSGATGSNLDALALAHLGERSSEYGRIRGWESFSYAIACVVFGLALEAAGVHWALALYAAACTLSFVWAGTMERDAPRYRAEEHGRLGAVGAVFRRAPRFWLFLLASLSLWVGFTGAWNFIALRIHSRGGGPLLVAIGAALGGGIEVPIMRLSSRLSGRVGLRVVYVAGCGVYVLGFLLWGLVNDPVALSMLTLLEGVGFALVFTSSVVVVGRMVPPSLHATAQSVSTSVGFGIAPMLGGATGGFVYQHLGQTTLYVGASAMAAAGGLIAWLALSAPEFTRPAPIEVEAVPPHGPEAG